MRSRSLLFFAIGLVLVAFTGFFLTRDSRTEAQRSISVRFEYAVINGSFLSSPIEGPGFASASVNICYFRASGCQNEEIRSDVNIGKFLQDERLENLPRSRALAQERAVQTSFAKAISKLGADGWEMFDAPSIEFDLFYVNQQNIPTVKEGLRTDRQHIWFKRAQQ